MSAPTSARIAPLLAAHEALRWLDRGAEGGALCLMVTRAKGSAVKCAANPDALGRMHAALDAAMTMGASRALLWQLDGFARVGEPIAIAGALAESRAQASAAVDELLSGLKGVAERTDA